MYSLFLIFYNILLALIILFLFPYFFLRAYITGKDKHGLFQRVGIISKKIFKNREYLWFHAVSAGEVKASVPVIEKFLDRENIVVSVGTETGYKMVREHFGNKVDIFYLPIDFFPFLYRIFNIISPKMLVIVETEIWPQLVTLANSKKVPVLLINGRIPPKDYKNYSRFSFLWRVVFKMYSEILVQSDSEKKAFIDAGASKEKVKVFGNTKYDVYKDNKSDKRMDEISKIFSIKDNFKKIVVIGSTHKGEEEILFSNLPKNSDCIYILAPRHPERAEEVGAVLERFGFSYEFRSEEVSWKKDVIIWDTMGELDILYKFSDFVFVGGSWIPQGGHNFIEPAIWGKPIVVGPYMHNFQDIYDFFVENNAILTVKSDEIANIMEKFLSDDEMILAVGENAKKCVELNRGAAERYAEVIENYL